MEIILVLLIVAVLNGAVAYIDEMLQELVPMTLYADRYMLAANGGSMVDVLFDILLGFGVSLIILKFLKKGFECYVMWTDGDPDTEPAGLVIRFMQAVAVAVCFPIACGLGCLWRVWGFWITIRAYSRPISTSSFRVPLRWLFRSVFASWA